MVIIGKQCRFPLAETVSKFFTIADFSKTSIQKSLIISIACIFGTELDQAPSGPSDPVYLLLHLLHPGVTLYGEEISLNEIQLDISMNPVQLNT